MREVVCNELVGQEVNRTVNDTVCLRAGRRLPRRVRSCNTDPCPVWKVGPFGEVRTFGSPLLLERYVPLAALYFWIGMYLWQPFTIGEVCTFGSPLLLERYVLFNDKSSGNHTMRDTLTIVCYI